MPLLAFVFLLLPAVLMANPVPAAPHGGKIAEAKTFRKDDERSGRLFVEMVRKGDELTIYPYLLAQQETPSLLPVSLRDLSGVILRLGADAINTQKTLAAHFTPSAIVTTIDVKDARFNKLFVTLDYKKGTREARLPLACKAE